MPDIDPRQILDDVVEVGSTAHTLLLDHGQRVAQVAQAIADRVAELDPDRAFLEQAALLHDVGAPFTNVPSLGFLGPDPYVRHGVIGRRLLEDRGLPRHALVCERHLGAGLSAADIRERGLPLPERDMLPLTLEERIICYADKYHSKGSPTLRSLDQVLASLAYHGPEQLQRIQALADEFGPPPFEARPGSEPG